MKKWLILLLVFFLFSAQSWGQIEYKVIIQSPFQPIGKLALDYPEELKKTGEAARILISLHIDEKGKVFWSHVWKTHYPELDKWIRKEVQQWKFKPFLHKGKPISAQGFFRVIFYPERKPRRSEGIEYSRALTTNVSYELPEGKLKTILDACADYCQKLSDYALFYVCLEIINENFKCVVDEFMGNLSFSGGPKLDLNEHIASPLYQLRLKDMNKGSYAFDYQLIKKDAKIHEKRILLGKTDELTEQNRNSSGTKLSYHLCPVLAPVHFLSREQRPFFLYKMVASDKVIGKKAQVIEITPRLEFPGDFQRCTVWVDEKDYRILKIEVETFYTEGFEEVYQECSENFLTPYFRFTHLYEVEKNGILFPSRSEVRIDYFGLLSSKRELKSKAEITYSSYRFFIVDVDHVVIKKRMEELISKYRSTQILLLQNLYYLQWDIF